MLLGGLRVIDCGTWVAAPAAATALGDFGAEVIKVEAPPGGDTYRWCAQFVPGFPRSEHNYAWQLTARNKKSVLLDLKGEQGYAALIALVKTADVFLTNFPPAVLEKLRIRWEDLAAHNPRLVYGQLTGYGEHGPHANLPAFDRTGWWARSGMMDRMRYTGSPPAGGVLGWGDHASSMALFGAVMTGLYRRERTGEGGRVHTSLLANGLWANGIPMAARLAGAAVETEKPRLEMDNTLAIPYETRDGHWFYPWMFDEERDWLRFAIALGLEALGEDARFAETAARRANARALIDAFDRRIAQDDWSHWQRVMAEHSIDLISVATLDEVIADPQVRLNQYLLPLDQPLGPATHTVNSPMFVDGAEKRGAGPAPALGEHTAEVLAALGLAPPLA
jgi:crotonobetainyl-CoA:carnitine CoA-transferase CaiB-like acyl-CoA transferase